MGKDQDAHSQPLRRSWEADIFFYLLPLHQHQKHLERLSQRSVMFAAYK